MYYNLHAHNAPKEKSENVSTIINLSPFSIPDEQNYYSIGIHPWHIKQNEIGEGIQHVRQYAKHPNVKAIGECGLDKLCETNFNLQKEIFAEQISISETCKKPLIIHCVKAFDEIITIKKEIKPSQTWIIHGFRGKPQQAEQLVKQGFYLSFGSVFNEISLRIIPIEKIFFETDDKNCDIQSVYQKSAKILILDEQILIQQIEKNISYLHFYS